MIEGSFSVVTGHDRIQPIALGTRGLNHRETVVSALVSAFGIALLSPFVSVSHTFLLEPGTWLLQGNWIERQQQPIDVKGKTLISWNRDSWFTMATRLIFPGSTQENIDLQFRGRFDTDDRRYTFVLQHTSLGRVEGEGWIAPDSIIQRYWAIGDKQRRTGFETLHRVEDHKYLLSSGIMAGHYLISAMEATVERAA